MQQPLITNLKVILILSARGYSYEEIAKFLNCKTRNVKETISRTLKRTDTSNLTELLTWALKEKFLTLEEI